MLAIVVAKASPRALGVLAVVHGWPTHVQLIAVRSPILTVCGAPVLVLEGHGNSVARVCPQLLNKLILVLGRPLAAEEGLNFVAAAEELAAVTPLRVGRVRPCNGARVAAIPGILSEPHWSWRP